MKKLILLASIIVSLASCGSQSGNQIPITVVKAIVIESGTKTFIRIPNTLKDVYSVGDTVYLDLLTHRINEIDTTTARVVIIK
jgi:hypothetical protein